MQQRLNNAQISNGRILLAMVLNAYYNKPSQLLIRKKYMIEKKTGCTSAARASIGFDAATVEVTDDIQPKKHSTTHPAVEAPEAMTQPADEVAYLAYANTLQTQAYAEMSAPDAQAKKGAELVYRCRACHGIYREVCLRAIACLFIRLGMRALCSLTRSPRSQSWHPHSRSQMRSAVKYLTQSSMRARMDGKLILMMQSMPLSLRMALQGASHDLQLDAPQVMEVNND